MKKLTQKKLDGIYRKLVRDGGSPGSVPTFLFDGKKWIMCKSRKKKK